MLTPRQAELLAFVESYIGEHGFGPSFQEMAAALGSHKGNIHWLLTRLEDRGVIRRIPHRQRAIEVVKGVRASPVRVRELIDAVDAMGGCVCPYGIGHPSFSSHSDTCERLHAALARVRE